LMVVYMASDLKGRMTLKDVAGGALHKSDRGKRINAPTILEIFKISILPGKSVYKCGNRYP
jgi:hypothetical protein